MSGGVRNTSGRDINGFAKVVSNTNISSVLVANTTSNIGSKSLKKVARL